MHLQESTYEHRGTTNEQSAENNYLHVKFDPANTHRRHNVVTTSLQHHDVAVTLEDVAVTLCVYWGESSTSFTRAKYRA